MHKLTYQSRFGYLAGTDTTRAYPHPFCRAVICHYTDFLKIWQPPALIKVVRMADMVTDDRPFTAYFTFLCHNDPQVTFQKEFNYNKY